jgi:rhodanese-related sulfurtransferase
MSIPKVLEIQPLALKKRLDDGEDVCLIDVREAWEHSLAEIPGSEHFPIGELVDRVQELLYEENIVVYCHMGERSYRGVIILMASGFKNVQNLVGGIDGWSQVVDASVPRYRAEG